MYIGEAVYIPEKCVDEVQRLYETIARTGNKAKDDMLYRPLAKAFLKVEFSDLEICNFHKDHVNPLTDVKMKAFKSE